MDLNTAQTKIDFIASGGHKWLNSPFGMGFLYVNKGIINDFKPVYRLKNTVVPKGGWDAFFSDRNKQPITDYEFRKDAKKFEYGSCGNYLPIVGATESISLINKAGIKNVESHILKLKKLLISELEKLGAKIIPPENERNYSSITTFNIKKNFEEDMKLLDKLNNNGVRVSGRGTSGIGGIRVSIHHVNTEDDIMRLIENIKKD